MNVRWMEMNASLNPEILKPKWNIRKYVQLRKIHKTGKIEPETDGFRLSGWMKKVLESSKSALKGDEVCEEVKGQVIPG